MCFLRLREVVQSGEEEGLENPESPFQYLKGAYKKKGESDFLPRQIMTEQGRMVLN